MSSDKGKSSSSKQLPSSARVYRSGRAGSRKRKRGGGLAGALFGPIGAILLGLGLVLLIGYYAGLLTSPTSGSVGDKEGKDQPPAGEVAKEDPPKSDPPTSRPVPAPTTPTPAPAPAPAPPKEQPAPQQPTPPPQPAPQQPANPTASRSRIDRSGGAERTLLTTIYYVDGLKNAESLQPVEVRVPVSQSRAKVVAEQVVNAPQNLSLYSGLPEGTKVLSVNLNAQTGVLTVDLSAEARGVQGTAAATNVQASLVYSLTEIPGVEAVQLWILGHPAVLHGIEWSKPITRADLAARNLYKVEPVIKFVP